MTTSDVKESKDSKENGQTEDSTSSTTKGTASAKKQSGRPDFVYDLRDRESFYKDLQTFHENRSTPIVRFPKINGKEIDLHQLYAEVVKRGGWLKVNIRNEWHELLHLLGVDQKCVNASVALKHIYTRYLDKYERLHFLGEDPDRVDEPEDESSRHKKWSTKNVTTVPMTYNHSQHQISEQLRVMHRLSTDVYKPSEYDKLILSLLSPLPNEQDFAINVCTLMANEGQHTLKLDHCPKLVDVLIAHCGVFGHFSMRDIFIEMYTKIRKRSLQTFWTDCLYDKPPILELSYDDYCQAPDEKFADMGAYRLTEGLRFLSPGTNETSVDPEVFKEDVGKYDYLCLGRGLGTHDYIGQRVQQVSSIMRNLSFFEENLTTLATNRTFIRFLVMLANVRWGNLHHMAFDILGNIATQVSLLDSTSDDLTRAIFTTLCEGLEGQDRGVIISSLEILNKLSQKDTNRKSLTKYLDFKTYNQICLFLALNDIMLLLYTLECLYGLSSLGSRPCNFIIQVKGIVDTLVSLITVEAQSYGPDGCILMRVVETVPGNMLPMVAQNIANLQNVAMQGHVLTVKKEAHEAALAAAANHESQKAMIAAQGGTPVRGIPQAIKDNTSTPQTPVATKTLSGVQESEPFAIAWMTATFESVASPGSRVEQQELYKMYLVACQKAGRRGSVSPLHFPQIVRTVLGPNVGPNLIKTTEPNGADLNAYYYVNIRMRANPMPVQYKAPTMQVQQTVNQTPVGSAGQKIITKTQTTPTIPQSPAVQQHQVKIVQQTAADAAVVASPNKKPEVGLKGKTTPKKIVGPPPAQSSPMQQMPSQLPTSQSAQQQQQVQVQQQSNPTVQQTVHVSQQTSQIQQQHVQHQPQIVTQLQENQLVAGKHVIISHSVASQQVLQKPPLTTESNQTIIQQQQHVQAQPQQIQIQQQPPMQIQQQQIQIQQQPQPMQIGQSPQQQQHQNPQIQLQSHQGNPQVIINPNGSTTLIQGNGNMSQSSLIKSLLANKVTTSPSATSDVIEANASAAPNNPSCLITQNVNLHQVAQRQQLKQQQQAQQQQQQQQHQQQQHQQQQHQQQQHHQQQQNVTHATISSLVNNPVISSNAVKVGQTTIKAITSNAILPASVIEKKPTQIIQPPQQSTTPSSVDSTDNVNSSWDPVPPLAPLSGNLQNIKIHSNMLITPGNDDSNSTGNNSVASSAMSSTQVATTDDGEVSLMSFEGLLIPKSKSDTSSVTEDEASKDSFNRVQVQGNQMLVELLDKKSPEPPAMSMGSGMKRKHEEDLLAEHNQKRLAGGNSTDGLGGLEERPMVQASKNAAKLFEEMAASILEDEDLEDETELLEPSIPIIPPPVEQKQIITMPVPIQRQIIMGPNNQVILTQPGQPMNQPVQPQATATIKTESGLQTVPLIIQKQIGPNGQSIIQPVIHQQQPTQTQYMLATNPQGQTYLVAQQTGHQQTLNPALLLAQTGQQQGTQTKTIIILQQQGGPPQAVAQQQIISNAGGQQKVIMTTQQGQQMIVTQVPRPVQHHQIIVSNQNPNIMQNGPGQNVILSQNASMVQQNQIPQQIQIQTTQGSQQQLQIQQAPVGQQQIQLPQQQIQIQAQQSQIQIHPVQQQQMQIQSTPHSVIQKQMHISQVGNTSIQVTPSVTIQPQTQATIQIQANQQQSSMQSQNFQQQPPPSILSQLPQIPATIKIHPSSAQMTQTPTKMPPVKPQIVLQQTANIPTQTTPIQQQQSVIQTAQSQQRSEVKRQIIVTGSGTIEMTESPKRVMASSVNQAVPQQSVQQGHVTQQHPQSPVQQPQPQMPPQHTPSPSQQQQQPQPQPQTPAPVAKKPPAKTEAPVVDDDSFDHNWPWICDWRGCPRKEYKSLADVYRHACLVHCPEGLDAAAEIYCQWGPGSGLCDNIPRKRYSLMTHLLDRHCTVESFKAACQRRISTGVLPPVHGQPVTIVKNVPSNSSESRGTASPAPSTSSSGSLPPAASAAMHAIKRHSNDFVNPKELMDENEGPVTKSIRLTAALILRNLVAHTSLAKRNLRCYEPHLAGVALSNVESSRTISQILYELNN